jgi:hypothetical protein
MPDPRAIPDGGCDSGRVALTVLLFLSTGLVRFVRRASAADSIQISSRGVDTVGSVTVERVA